MHFKQLVICKAGPCHAVDSKSDYRFRGWSSIPAQSHTLVEIDHEIFSTVVLLILLIQEGLLSVVSESMCKKYWFTT